MASRYIIRIYLIIAALNNLAIKSKDIGNAYINAHNKEKVHLTSGPELVGRQHQGKTTVIIRALFGLKSAGNACRHLFS